MTPAGPEANARANIDQLLTLAGWAVQDNDAANFYAARGVAIREHPLKSGHGFADYLLYVDGAAVGVVEAKKVGNTLTGVETQATKYSQGFPAHLPAYRRPLPYLYVTTGVETRFTNLMDPDPRSRQVFAFHKPETLRDWLNEAGYTAALTKVAELPTPYMGAPAQTLRGRLKAMPPLIATHLWPAQERAIQNLEKSLGDDRPRSLIQMATGSGKTFTACNFIYRLIKHARAKRVLFLVDRGNLGRQTYKEFQQFATPDDGRKFTELYNVQHLQSNKLDPVSRVCITTVQRLYSMLQGQELDPEQEERSTYDAGLLLKEPVPVRFNPEIPIETFDVIVVDECHRSIYNLWAQVLEYFDAHLIGLTATPSKQTLGFFNQNLVMEYNHEQAVADGVNVDFEVYRIKTEITDQGARVEAGISLEKRDRLTRARRWSQLDDEFTYGANQLDRAVVAKDQIRTVIRTFKEKLFTEIFPGRTVVPKTLIFAKDDSHAEDIIEIVREEFAKGNDFAQKITYKTSGVKPEELIAQFRTGYDPRIAVTVDMIATGTDIKPLEIVFFMRSVKSRNFFEQMKGRGVRVMNSTDFQVVTPGAKAKTHFVIVDAVGVCEQEMSDSRPLEQKRAVPFETLLDAVAKGNRDEDVLTSLASRLARLDKQLTKEDRQALRDVAGQDLKAITQAIIAAVDPDVPAEEAPQLIATAVMPIAANPAFRKKLLEVKRAYEQVIDAVSKDRVLEAGFSDQAKEKARGLVQSFERFVAENKDAITALQVLYSKPYGQRLSFRQIKELAQAIQRPPQAWTAELLWRAYETLDRSKVHGSGGRVLTDIVSLIRFALHQEDELVPYAEKVKERFAGWLAQQEQRGRVFSDEQRLWLEAIRDHVATSLEIGVDDFEYAPFNQRGGVGRAVQVFGPELPGLLDELNQALGA